MVAELAAQEFLRSGLKLEVDNSELSLYVSICYEREKLSKGLNLNFLQT